MNTKTEQQAADAYAAFKQAERDRWARVKAGAAPCTSAWRPVMTEQQKQDHERYAIEHRLPF